MGDVTLNHFFKRIEFGVPDFSPRAFAAVGAGPSADGVCAARRRLGLRRAGAGPAADGVGDVAWLHAAASAAGRARCAPRAGRQRAVWSISAAGASARAAVRAALAASRMDRPGARSDGDAEPRRARAAALRGRSAAARSLAGTQLVARAAGLVRVQQRDAGGDGLAAGLAAGRGRAACAVGLPRPGPAAPPSALRRPAGRGRAPSSA